MPSLSAVIFGGTAHREQRPWPRAVVGLEGWQQAAQSLRAGAWSLLGLWGEPGLAHMAVIEGETNECAVLSLACEANRFILGAAIGDDDLFGSGNGPEGRRQAGFGVQRRDYDRNTH